MLDFLVAFFGGLFYGGKSLDDKLQTLDYSNREKTYHKTHDRIYNYQKIISMPYPKNQEEFWTMTDSIKDDLKYIFGESWKREMERAMFGKQYSYQFFKECCHSSVPGTFQSVLQIPYEVWISKQGLSCREAFNYSGIGELVSGSEKDKGIALRALETIEKNLQNCHPDLELRLRTDTTQNHSYKLVWEHYQIIYNLVLGKRLW